jgi:putative salt-induced outer membrane protein
MRAIVNDCLKVISLAVLGCLVALLRPGLAEDTTGAAPKPFTNKTRFSMVDTGGNTDTLTLAGENKLQYRFSEKWEGTWGVGAVHQEADSSIETERYFADLRLDAAIGTKLYAYLLASWERDVFAGFEHRIGLGPGVGCKILNGPRQFLSWEYGWNYRHETYAEKTEAPEDFLEGRLFAGYKWAFTEETHFSQTLEYLQSYAVEESYKINAETALVTALNSITAIEISYKVRYNNNPIPQTLENIDTTFATSLLFKF